ncbi:unnamed protein product [Periconia digitata]|uniref:Uncharacterized protein n=1 Tax=Periconia digitata TaxID=1303443 RepID=A0A9W4UR68_9PLEO|nr:unnamed protein product [Periconia digitata]
MLSEFAGPRVFVTGCRCFILPSSRAWCGMWNITKQYSGCSSLPVVAAHP